MSNHYLSPEAQLGPDAITALEAAGWHPPDESTNNFHRVWDQPSPYAEIACAAIRALIEALAVPSPDRLVHWAYEEGGHPDVVPVPVVVAS